MNVVKWTLICYKNKSKAPHLPCHPHLIPHKSPQLAIFHALTSINYTHVWLVTFFLKIYITDICLSQYISPNFLTAK